MNRIVSSDHYDRDDYYIPTPAEAREYLAMHNKRIRDWNADLSDSEIVDWFNRVHETHPMEREDGWVYLEISRFESKSGNPEIFMLDRSGLDWQWQVSHYRKPFDQRVTPQDHESQLEFFDDEREAQRRAEKLAASAHEITLTAPQAAQVWALESGEWS